MSPVTHERRRAPRLLPPSRLAIALVQPSEAVVDHVNVSAGGLCLRLERALEVRSLVRFQVTPKGALPVRRGLGGLEPLECTGRVAWVTQRLDLRTAPPFLFDIGIEFIDPPRRLRELVVPSDRRGGEAASGFAERLLAPAAIQGRSFVPRLTRGDGHPTPWHLVVAVDGTPCFSGRYASLHEATDAWGAFQRRRAAQDRKRGAVR